MSELTDKLRERLELDTDNWCMDYESGWVAKTESLAPLHELLLQAVEALEEVNDYTASSWGIEQERPGIKEIVLAVLNKLRDEVEK